VSDLTATAGVLSVRREAVAPALLPLPDGRSSVPLRLSSSERLLPAPDIGRSAAQSTEAVIPSTVAKLLGRPGPEALGTFVDLRPQTLAVTPNGPQLIGSGALVRLQIVGVRDVERSDESVRNPSDILVPLDVVREIQRKLDPSVDMTYSSLLVEATDPPSALRLMRELRARGFGVSSLQASIDQLQAGFDALRVILGGIAAIAVLIACLGVTNTMLMAVLERTREIGLLRAVGASSAMVRTTFLTEAAVLGVAGTAFGAAAALVLTRGVDPLLRGQLAQVGAPLPRGSLFQIGPELVAPTCLVVVAVTILAAWLPSERAVRMSASEALRND
jgi:putative ABC transport system permease protein